MLTKVTMLALTISVFLCVPGAGATDTSDQELLQIATALADYPASASDLFMVDDTLRAAKNFDSRLSIFLNSNPPIGGAINVFFFSTDGASSIESVGKFAGNCAYVSKFHSVFCDGAFISKVIRYYEFDKTSGCSVTREDGSCWAHEEIVIDAPPEHVEAYRHELISWIISHEIGHARAGHQGSFFFATPDGQDERTSSTEPVELSLNDCQNFEVEADSFFAKLLNADGSSQGFRSFLETIFAKEQKRASCPGKSLALSQNCPIPVGPVLPFPLDGEKYNVSSSNRHPAFFIRALLFMRELKTKDNIVDKIYAESAHIYLEEMMIHHNEAARTSFNCAK